MHTIAHHHGLFCTGDEMSAVPQLPPIDPNRRYPLDQANQYLGQSRAKTYKDIAAGTLRTIKDGKRVYIPGSEIIRRSTLPEQS